MMKYGVNHWWKFNHANIAFLAGLLQVSSAVVISLVIYTSIIIPALSVIDLLRDFVTMIFIYKLDFLLAHLSQEH